MHAKTGYSTIYSPVSHHSEAHSVRWNAQHVAVAGLTAGTLYGGATVLWSTLSQGRLTLIPMLRWVTAGMLGENAPVSEASAVAIGVFVHMSLSVALGVGYSTIVARFPVPRGSEVIAGLAYGALVGVVMSGFIFPLAHIEAGLFDANRFLLFVSIHMLFVGVPLALILGRSDNR